jgi:DNA-binding SARP family transcriptional activator
MPPEPPPPAQGSGVGPATRLCVFGSPVLSVRGSDVEIRGKARELLTYLAVHPHGATRDTLLETLYPDADRQHAAAQFDAVLAEIRAQVRQTAGLPDEDLLTQDADRYRLNPDRVEVDLWRFQTGYQNAIDGEGPDRVAVLGEMAAAYRGDLAADQPYEWIEPEREALRHQAVHVLRVLADLTAEHEPEQALRFLQQAVTIDPYAEDAYRRVLVLQARLEDTDGIYRTYRLLETRLEDIGIDPERSKSAFREHFRSGIMRCWQRLPTRTRYTLRGRTVETRRGEFSGILSPCSGDRRLVRTRPAARRPRQHALCGMSGGRPGATPPTLRPCRTTRVGPPGPRTCTNLLWLCHMSPLTTGPAITRSIRWVGSRSSSSAIRDWMRSIPRPGNAIRM